MIVLWNHEPVYESPARKTFNLTWSGELTRADFTIDVDPNFWLLPLGSVFIDKIVLNGSDVAWRGDPNDIVTFDGKPYLRKGANIIEIYHNARSPFGLPIGIQTAGVYAYVNIESLEGNIGGEIISPPPGFELPWWIWLLVVLVVVLLVLRR